MDSQELPRAPSRPAIIRIHHTASLLLVSAGSAAAAALVYDVLLQWEYAAAALPGSTIGHVLALTCSAVLGIAASVRLGRNWRSGRWTSTSGAPFRWAIVVGVASVVLQVCIQPDPFSALAAGVTLAEGFGVYALGLHLAPRLIQLVPARLSKAVGIVAFNLALLPVSAELLLRVWGSAHPIHLLDHGQLEADVWVQNFRFDPGHVYLGFPCNRNGFYDTDPPTGNDRGPLVVSIGDSFSAGVVPLPFHFTSVSEELVPDLQVYNVGIPCADPTHYLSLLKSEALPLRPDLILINFFVGNDLVLRRRIGHEAGGLRAWLDRNGSATYVLLARWAILRREAETLGIEPRNVGAVDAGSTLDSSMTIDDILIRSPWLTDPMRERPTLSERTFIEIETGIARYVCRPPAANSLVDYGLSLDMLEAMRRAAADIPLVVMIIPDEFQVEDELWATIVREAGNQDLSRFLPQQVVRAWLESHGIAYLDLLPILRAQAPLADGRRHLYHRCDTHFNARGNRIVGEALAGFLVDHMQKPR